MAVPIGTLGTIPTLTVAGRVFTDLTTLKTVVGFATGTNKGTCRAPAATSGYQVTSGKILTIAAVTAVVNGTAGALAIAQTDNDVGVDSSGSLTNAVYQVSSAASMSSYASTVMSFAPNFPVAATKYFTFTPGASSCGIFLTGYGYEA